MVKKVLEEAISKIESKEKNKESRKIAEGIKKKCLRKYSDVVKKKLERGDKSGVSQFALRQQRIPTSSLLTAGPLSLSLPTTGSQLIEKSKIFFVQA